jgi:hypothetical protein
MTRIYKSSKEKYYILSKDNSDIYHYGKLSVGQTLISGFDNAEKFISISAFESRLMELGLYEEYLENNENE